MIWRANTSSVRPCSRVNMFGSGEQTANVPNTVPFGAKIGAAAYDRQ